MNVRLRVEVENKKNDFSLYRPMLWIVSVCQGKYRQKNKKIQERKKEKNTVRTQTKLNGPQIMYNVKN